MISVVLVTKCVIGNLSKKAKMIICCRSCTLATRQFNIKGGCGMSIIVVTN